MSRLHRRPWVTYPSFVRPMRCDEAIASDVCGDEWPEGATHLLTCCSRRHANAALGTEASDGIPDIRPAVLSTLPSDHDRLGIDRLILHRLILLTSRFP